MDTMEFIDKVNVSTRHPTNYAGAVKKKQAHLAHKKPTFTEAGMFKVLVNLNKPTTHHQSNSSFLAMLESTTNVQCDDIVKMVC
jgi:hypothetical protein